MKRKISFGSYPFLSECLCAEEGAEHKLDLRSSIQECKQGYHLVRGCELQSLVMLGREEEVKLQKYQAKDLRFQYG